MYSGVPLIDVSTNVETLMALAKLEYSHNYFFSMKKATQQPLLKMINVDKFLPKVTQLHHPTFSKEDILRFYVTVNDAMGM